MTTFEDSAEDVAQTIGIPLEAWPGQCYGIACLLLDKGVVEGVPRYGHWLGPVSPNCPVEGFRNGAPFQRHGWIETAAGGIIDPTRWVFEGRDPYVYDGPSDFYDAGGNALREAFESPCPGYDSAAERSRIAIWKHSRAAHQFVVTELLEGSPGITSEQEFWLANLALSRFGPYARAVYQAIVDAGNAEFIPIDNRMIVLGDDA